jgi:DNA-binding NarL/FixJ family response regulator
MTQASSAARRSALIVEDEFLIALDLEADMRALGFDVCGLAPSASKARSLAMTNQPDVVLMDVNLEGGRDGIEAARWLREVCETAVVFVTSYNDDDTVERIHERVPGAPVLPKPVYRERLADAVAEVGNLGLGSLS